VCRDDGTPGDYVQWNAMELFYLHDWNVLYVRDGRDFQKVLAAQRAAAAIENAQPTAIVYRTVKGWMYGIEGRLSHGAGHKLCSDGFYEALAELTGSGEIRLPTCEAGQQRCLVETGGRSILEDCFFESLSIVRRRIAEWGAMAAHFAGRLESARQRLNARRRVLRSDAPRVDAAYEIAAGGKGVIPPELVLQPGTLTTLRGELGRAFDYYNRRTGGAVFAASADLLGSTSVKTAGAGFGEGFWNAEDNPTSRLLSTGGICEDAMSGILSGLSTFGCHIGVGSSYGAFLAPLGHIAARLHCIGMQGRRLMHPSEPYKPMILVCAHAGLKTGEDGPTHADPQPLQLLQENFPRGSVITLTPWDPQEIWTLLSTALALRPALIAPFVTRPSEKVVNRAALGLEPVESAQTGIYILRKPKGEGKGTIVLQESAVTYAFVEIALPLLEKAGLDPWVYYVASAELFDLLPQEEQAAIFPEARAMEAMGITGFTLPTLYRWVKSDYGRKHSLHPFQKGRFLGSGQGWVVLQEAGLDGQSQFDAVRSYAAGLEH